MFVICKHVHMYSKLTFFFYHLSCSIQDLEIAADFNIAVTTVELLAKLKSTNFVMVSILDIKASLYQMDFVIIHVKIVI